MPIGVPFFVPDLFLDPSPVIAGKYKAERCTQAHTNCQIVNSKANARANSYTSAVEQEGAFMHFK
jgi:hypothetical protein